jgi:hypothetical protein
MIESKLQSHLQGSEKAFLLEAILDKCAEDQGELEHREAAERP